MLTPPWDIAGSDPMIGRLSPTTIRNHGVLTASPLANA